MITNDLGCHYALRSITDWACLKQSQINLVTQWSPVAHIWTRATFSLFSTRVPNEIFSNYPIVPSGLSKFAPRILMTFLIENC